VTIGIGDTGAIGYLPQQADVDRSFPITVWDTVALGLWREIGVFGGIRPKQKERVGGALAATGLEGLGKRPVGMLSVGQFQRVLFARLLVQDARILLLDEPFAGVDERTTADLIEIVRRWHAENRTIIAVLHDIEQVRAHFPSTLLIAREPIGWGPTAAVLTEDNLARARMLSRGWGEAPFNVHGRH
jgi:zinc/manganese transport system ATP-binding protein